jgi:MtN3 and saliva related transmembrane protein
VSQNSNAQHTHKKSAKSFIDRLIFVAVIATPVTTLPQVYKIWFQHSQGASLFTWTSYVLIAFIWLAYGLKYNDKPIIIMQTLCIIVYSSVVIGLAR